MTMPHLVRVADLFVTCSFQLRNIGRPGFAMSDCCREPADSAVEMANGDLMNRCPRHRGQRTASETGRVVWEVRRPS